MGRVCVCYHDNSKLRESILTNSGHQNGYGSSGRCMCPCRPNADGSITCHRKPGCDSQQGRAAPSRAATYN